MFGPRQNVGGTIRRVGIFVSQNDGFRRPGDHINHDLAIRQHLGRLGIDAARPGNLQHRLDRFCAKGHRGNARHPAHPINFIRACQISSDQHFRVLTGGRKTGNHPGYARRFGRHRQNLHHGRQRNLTGWHSKTH